MADIRRLVTINPIFATIAIVRDLEDTVSFFAVRDSFTIRPADRQTVYAQRQRRYGGARAIAESHGNAAISWQAMVRGTTANQCLVNVEAMLGDLETRRLDNLYLEWRPDGATQSVYYDIVGPATWTPTYRWAQFAGAKSMLVDIQIPVAPLALGTSVTQTIASTTVPAVVQLASPIPGDAPALADIAIRTGNGTGAAPVFALIAWTARGTPSFGPPAYAPPFIVQDAETSPPVTGGTVVSGDANYRNSGGRTFTNGSTTTIEIALDPTGMTPGVFEGDEATFEVWARVKLDAGLGNPTLTAKLRKYFYATRWAYTQEYGSTGKLLVQPGTGSAFRFVRLGTLRIPIGTFNASPWVLGITGSSDGGSTGTFALDYVVVVPVAQRALTPTGKLNDSSYPAFIASNTDITKLVRGETLAGYAGLNTANKQPDPGMGGAPIELPPGNVDLLIKLSSLVPDDPSDSTASEQLSHTITGTVRIWPRFWVARGA